MTETAPITNFQPVELTDADSNHQPAATDAPTPDKRRNSSRNRWVVGAVGALAAVGWFVVTNDSGTNSDGDDVPTVPANTADVIVTDLVQETSFDGTLGTIAGEPISASTDGVVTAIAASGATVHESDVLYRIDDEPVSLLYGDTPAYRDITLGSQSASILAAGSGVVTDIAAVGSIIEQGDIAYWVDGQPVVALYGTSPMFRTLENLSPDIAGADVLQLEQALAELGFTLDDTLDIDGVFTFGTRLAVEDWQEAHWLEIDGIVEVTDVVFIPGPSQVVELEVSTGGSVNPGVPVMALSTGDALTGDDVAQLEESLADQGFDANGTMTVDGVFTVETRQAVIDWQTSVGQTADGVVNLGDAVFLPTSARIAEQLVTPGASVNVGTPIVGISSADQVVRVDIRAADQGLIEIGDAVTVILPAFDETPATIASISTTVTIGPDGDALFEAIVELDDATAAAGLNEAPVTVEVVGESVTGVTAVPVTALVALVEGGYAVEKQTANGYQLVRVEPGFFADGLVEITSDSLTVGDTVAQP